MKKGFAVLEIIVVLIFASAAVALFFVQKSELEAISRDDLKKTAVNAMHYALEKSFYETHKYYPEEISEDVLTVVDPALFVDSAGYHLGDPACAYTYLPANCEQGKCKEYVLNAKLEKEKTYTKYNLE